MNKNKIKFNTTNNRRGSTLIWVLILMLVLGILITAGLAIAQAYSSRSITQHTEKQSYYTALSVTKTMAEWLSGANLSSESNPTNESNAVEYIKSLRSIENKTKTESFDLSDQNLGECVTTISMNNANEDIIITSKANYDNQESTVQATLKRKASEEYVDTGEWPEPGDVDFNESIPTDSNSSGLTVYNFEIRRQLGIDLSKSNNRYNIKNTNSGSNTYNHQYFDITTDKIASGDKNIFFQLVSGTADSNQSKGMALYFKNNVSGDTNYNRLYLYSDSKNSTPCKEVIAVLPQTTFREVTLGIRLGEAKYKLGSFQNMTSYCFKEHSVYRNHTYYINDNSLKEFQILGGITLINPEIITTRPTQIGKHWTVTNDKTSNNMSVAVKDGERLMNVGFISGNGNFVGYQSNINSNTIINNGNLVVKNNTTTLSDNVTYKGKILVESPNNTNTPTLQVNSLCTINKPDNSTSNTVLVVKNRGKAYIEGKVNGNIIIESGGTLTLSNKAKITGTIYVKGNGKLNITEKAKVNGDIYGYSDSNGNAEISSNGSSSSGTPSITKISQNELGGIFIQGSSDGNTGAVYTQNGSISFLNGAFVHVLKGATYNQYSGADNRCDNIDEFGYCRDLSEEMTVSETWTLGGYSKGK